MVYLIQFRIWLGRVAQLGERGVRNAEVEGSNPFASTNATGAPCCCVPR
jgi:hypothetical protein